MWTEFLKDIPILIHVTIDFPKKMDKVLTLGISLQQNKCEKLPQATTNHDELYFAKIIRSLRKLVTNQGVSIIQICFVSN